MKYTLIYLFFLFYALSVCAQRKEIETVKYHRSSIYSILLHHPSKQFDTEIVNVFKMIPLPEKFDEHNLSVRNIKGPVLKNKRKKQMEIQKLSINDFLYQNSIARRLVARWFGRNKMTGCFDTKLLSERGINDASFYDVKMAELSARGKAILEDAGEKLIGNTFVLVNDIRYIDKEEAADIVSGIFHLAGDVMDVASSNSVKNEAIGMAAKQVGDLTGSLSGFRVIITSYLYRLRWNEDVASAFYGKYYIEEPDAEKRRSFDEERDLFNLDYIGLISVTTGNITLARTISKEDMIRMVCTRAIDKSVAMLQHKYEEFRVKIPLHSILPLTVKIGLKEGVDENSRFEVLEMFEDSSGKTYYKRVGVIKPVKEKIWDNRFMAEYERNIDTLLVESTEFEKVSGGDFYEGMLVREIE